MKPVCGSALGLLLLVSGAAVAEEKGGAAAKLSRALLSRDTWDRTVEQMVQQLAAAHPSNVEPSQLRPVFDQMLPYEEVVDLQTGLLGRYYTPTELGELAAFYASPVGQKTLRVMSDLSRDVMAMVQTKVTRELPRAMEKAGLGGRGKPKK